MTSEERKQKRYENRQKKRKQKAEEICGKKSAGFCEKYHPKHAVRTSMSDFREQDWMTNIPLYNIDRIGEYLK